MFCKNCGFQNNQGEMFCKQCGTRLDNGVQQPTQQNNTNQFIQPQQSSQPDMMQQQPMNNQQYQQPQQSYGSSNSNGWQNSYNPTPNFQQQKPNSNVKYIVIGVVIVVAIFAGMFIEVRPLHPLKTPISISSSFNGNFTVVIPVQP